MHPRGNFEQNGRIRVNLETAAGLYNEPCGLAALKAFRMNCCQINWDQSKFLQLCLISICYDQSASPWFFFRLRRLASLFGDCVFLFVQNLSSLATFQIQFSNWPCFACKKAQLYARKSFLWPAEAVSKHFRLGPHGLSLFPARKYFCRRNMLSFHLIIKPFQR